MAYADDLLEVAQHLAKLDSDNPRQACLRRSVSTAYYALFHLLITEATSNWIRPELHSELPLGRLFGHGKMKSASKEQRSELNSQFKKNLPLETLTVFKHLHAVAHTFILAQEKREEADYDTWKEWNQTEVLKQIDSVAAAFQSWRTIREEPVAQAHLVSLLGIRPRSE
jgi:uncharacterized protein (UPF0332 family)